MKTYPQKGSDAFITINHKTSKKILVSNVVLLKGNINYTAFHLQYGEVKVVPRSIKFFETFLETHGFLRIHRSYMINPNHVKNYNQEQEIFSMTNGQEASISRRRKHTLKGFMN
jgi:DNA-binding LytR/AlgR family response regulator